MQLYRQVSLIKKFKNDFSDSPPVQSIVPFPDLLKKRKGGCGKWTGVEMYTMEC